METPSSGASVSKRSLRKKAALRAYDENLMDELLEKQLGGGSKKKNKTTEDIEKETETEAMIANSLGFPIDALLQEEIRAGVVKELGGKEQNDYIVIRNHILALWRENVNIWLTKGQIRETVSSDCEHLINSAYEFLLYNGYINFGVSPLFTSQMPETTEGNVVVIGAGLAGLAAARQLLSFGYKVVIVEGRNRPGGRVYTQKVGLGDKFAAVDLGGSVITGIHANPLGVLARQLSIPLHKVRDNCPLYKPNGAPVDKELDSSVESVFNGLLDRVMELRQIMGGFANDVSLESILEKLKLLYAVCKKRDEKQLLDWHFANLEYANAGCLSNLSAAHWDQDDPYKDFVSHSSEDFLEVSVGPDTSQDILNAIMNGVEIMKISNEVGSMDGFSSLQSILSTLPKNKTYKSVPSTWFQKIWIIIGCSVFVLMFLVFLGLSVCYLTARRSKTKSAVTSTFLTSFTFHAIQQATNDFDQNLLVGKGGFGKVYKGTLENGKTVAIKVANPESRQGLNEFRNEIELLRGLRHQNLVSLVGCCSEDSEMILVYKYMANGSFCSHLYGTDFVPLSWKQRLEICIGAAKGLYHLHTGAEQSIIHRDVKAANILLDENFVAKVADFGISKKGPPLDKSHVTTNVKGSFGYVDPEYFRTKCLTKKSDVYSFGVVLIEVICGKPALDDARPTQEINLAMWALCCHEEGTFHEMMDPYLVGKVNMDSLNRVSELAWKCLEEKRVNRPPMGYVLCELEEALHLELASQVRNGNGDSITHGSVENVITVDIEDVA